jgi:hypothetical protein
LNKIFRLPKATIQKALRKWLSIWRNNADTLKKNEAVNKLQRNYRRFSKISKENKISDRISKRLLTLALKNEDLKKKTFLKWVNSVIKNKIQESADKINNFVDKHWRRICAKKKWKKLTDGLYNRNYINNGLNLIFRFKKFKSLTKLFGFIDNKFKRDGFDDLKTKTRSNYMLSLIKAICNDYDNKNNLIFMKHQTSTQI